MMARTADVPCPACASRSASRLGHFHFHSERLGLVECRDCHLVYVSPRITEDAMRAFFQSYTDVSSVDRLGWLQINKQPNIQRDLYLLERFVPRGGRILDIGCGPGLFLREARARGYQTVGIEVSAPAAQFAAAHFGLDVRPGSLAEAGFAPKEFDGAMLFDVLYYLPDPLAELIEARTVLRDGGLLVVRVLNRVSYLRLWQSLIGRWSAETAGSLDRNPFVERDHLTHFDRSSTERILVKAGFDPLISVNSRMTTWLDHGAMTRLLRQLAIRGLDALQSVSGGRLCCAPSVTIVARKR